MIPSPPDGIIAALGGGLHAAEATAAVLAGRQGALTEYTDLLERAFSGYLADRHRHYASERRWTAEPFWRRRHGESNEEAQSSP